MFCSNCGAKLEDNARLCSSCGMAVSRSTSTPPTQEGEIELAKQRLEKLLGQTNEEREELIEQLVANNEYVQLIETDRKRKLQSWIEITKTGIVHDNNIEDGIENYNLWSKYVSQTLHKNPEHDPYIQVLRFYPVAKEIKSFFLERWYSEYSRDVSCDTVKRDWKSYIGSGFSGLLTIFTHMNAKDRNYLISDLKGLANWLEDELVKVALLAMQAGKVEYNESDIRYLIHQRLGNERMSKIVHQIAEAVESAKRRKEA